MSRHEITYESEDDEEYMEESKRIINVVCSILNEIINNEKSYENKKDFLDSKNFKFNLNNFEIKSNPNISLKNYLSRILKYIKPQPSTIIISLILIDKFCENSYINLNKKNIHKIFLTSIIVAIKYNEDEYFTNNYYAKVGGITQKELFNLEYIFLTLLDFNIYIDEKIYNNYKDKIDDL